jgi:tRNA pseudouridine55 synthase
MRRRAVDGILLIDKPLGLTSHQALQRCKGMFRAEKAGHTGALDPLASGLLPICFGQATKLSGWLLDGDKRYVATVQLGARTPSGDAESEPVEFSDPGQLTESGLRAAMAGFVGPQLQQPPMHSAVKFQGQPLYTLAREGIEVDRAPRAIEIRSLELLRFGEGRFEFEVACSKGTYIRTLAEDIARAAGQCAHLVALRRTGAAPFEQPRLVTLDALQALVDAREFEALDAHLQPTLVALPHWQRWKATEEQAHELAQGQFLRLPDANLEPGDVAVLDETGTLRGLAEYRMPWLRPKRWFSRD